MHNAALASIGGFAGWRYFPFDVPPAELADALDIMGSYDFHGINLTVPHKVLAVGMVSSLDSGADEVGAVNTLLREGAGWRGFNTDGYGLATALREDLGIVLEGTPIVLLGAGGAARGAAVECLRSGCAGLWIVNRTRSNLDSLMAHLAPLAGKVPVRALDPSAHANGLAAGAVVINATSAGLHRDDPSPIDLGNLPGISAVYDMIYNPPVTRLLQQARALGLPNCNGIGMLVHQGAKALEIWTGVPASATAPAMRGAAAKALGY
jgi:shikimate dehydrogenase